VLKSEINNNQLLTASGWSHWKKGVKQIKNKKK